MEVVTGKLVSRLPTRNHTFFLDTDEHNGLFNVQETSFLETSTSKLSTMRSVILLRSVFSRGSFSGSYSVESVWIGALHIRTQWFALIPFGKQIKLVKVIVTVPQFLIYTFPKNFFIYLFRMFHCLLVTVCLSFPRLSLHSPFPTAHSVLFSTNPPDAFWLSLLSPSPDQHIANLISPAAMWPTPSTLPPDSTFPHQPCSI